MYSKKYLLFLFLFTAGCSRAPVYFPNVQDVPLFSKKGQVHMGGYYNIDGHDIFSGEFAASITDRYAVMGNYTYRKESWNFGEFAVGKYWKNDEQKARELYVGLGLGNGHGEGIKGCDGIMFAGCDGEEVRSQAHYQRLFVQMNQQKRVGFFSTALSARISLVHASGYSRQDEDYPRWVDHKLNSPNWGAFFEPAWTLSLGPSKIKFTCQIGLSIPISPKTNFGQIPGWMLFGGHLDF